MANTAFEKSQRISFLAWLRELDEALNPDPVGALHQRIDRLEAKLEAIDTTNPPNPAIPASHE